MASSGREPSIVEVLEHRRRVCPEAPVLTMVRDDGRDATTLNVLDLHLRPSDLRSLSDAIAAEVE